jgi:hypothetical protein
LCKDILKQYIIIQKCNCSVTAFDYTFDKEYCTPKENDCVGSAKADFLSIEKYKNVCPLECKSMKYDFKTSVSKFPSLSYEKVLRETPIIKRALKKESKILDSFDFEQTVVSFDIHYDSFYQTHLTESKKTNFITLISNLGGLTGLFIGASVISFFEIFDLIIQVFFYFKNYSSNLVSPI